MQKVTPIPKEPSAIQIISQYVSNLISPPLALLQQTFIDQKLAIIEKRNELLRKRDETSNEGHEAAMRLMMLNEDLSQTYGNSYLQIINKRSYKNG